VIPVAMSVLLQLNTTLLSLSNLRFSLDISRFRSISQIHPEQMRVGAASSADSREKWVRQSQRQVVS